MRAQEANKRWERRHTHDLVRRLEAAEQRSALAARKARGTVLAALVLIVGLLALSLPPMAARAQKGGGGGGGGGLSLDSRVAALESQVTALQSENATQQNDIELLRSQTTTLYN
jgi:hypothetical protein